MRIVNPKKIYCIDNGFIKTNSVSFDDDNGRLLENMVFMHLRRTSNDIYYFAEKNECDFVVFQQKKIKALYQVCWQLDQENMDREVAGLREAMEYFDVNQACIITANQIDTFKLDNKTITVQPFYEWAKPM